MNRVLINTEESFRRTVYSYRAMVLMILALSLLTLTSIGQSGPSSLEISQNPSSRPERDVDSSFRYAWVTQSDVHVTKPTDQSSIEVAATAAVHARAFDRGSRLVYLLVRYMPNDTFTRVANTITVGIFNSDEFPSDFPEYSPVNIECKYTCPDNCSSFCEDGLPIAMKWSHPGRRLVVTAGNLLCGQDGQFDPEFGKMNLLVPDFAEALVKYVLPPDAVDSIIAAYNSSRTTWDLHPTNHVTYFRQGTATWFEATRKSVYETGGMNICSNAHPCATEMDLRRNLQTRDAPLFDILNSVYNYDRWNLTGNISVCTW